jgi:hypothetical protein
VALTDPQSITIAAATSSLPRTNVGSNKSEYTSPDGLIKLSLAHTYGRRTRRVLRLDHSKITSDPFIPSQNTKVSVSIYTVFDMPPAGYSSADVLAIYTGFKSLYSGSSDALISKLLGGES